MAGRVSHTCFRLSSGPTRDNEVRAPSANCCAEQYYVVGEDFCRPCASRCATGITEITPCVGAAGHLAPSNRVCRDTTPPVITLQGPTTVTVEGGGVWRDPGYTGTDSAFPFTLTNLVHVVQPNMRIVATQQARYTLSDAAGLSAVPQIRTVVVVDTTPPVISMLGNSVMDHEACCTTHGVALCSGSCRFNDPGATAVDAVGGPVPVTVTGGNFNVQVPGTHVVTYTAVDIYNNRASVNRTVNVVDGTHPIVTINGNYSQVFEAVNNTPYVDPGAVCADIVDGDLTSDMTTTTGPSGPVQINVPGTYFIYYDCQDQRSPPNVAPRVTRTIIVQDTTPPTITLTPPLNMTLEGGHTYVDPGYSAWDSLNGNITYLVTLTPFPQVDNVLPAGTTTVYTYHVTDAAGNSVVNPPNRTITIIDTTPPVITLFPNDTVLQHEICHDLVSTCNDIAYYQASDLLPPFNLTSQVVVTTNATLNYSAPVGTAFRIEYNVTDTVGLMTYHPGHVVVLVDQTFPTISMNDVDALNRTSVEAGTTYVDAGATASDTIPPFNLTSGITTSGIAGVNTLAVPLSEFDVTYSVTDDVGNTATAVRTVVIIDTVPPTLTVAGPVNINAQAGLPFTMPSYSAVDPVYGTNATVSVSAHVTFYVRDNTRLRCSGIDVASLPPAPSGQYANQYTSTVDTDYGAGSIIEVTFIATDAVGNSANVSRTVTLIDTLAPTITLIGSSTVTYEITSGSYSDQWAEAQDAASGDMTGCIMARVQGLTVDVNCSSAACVNNAMLQFANAPLNTVVTITYSVTDGQGLSASTTRTVTIADTIAPNVTVAGASLYTVVQNQAFTLPACVCEEFGAAPFNCTNDFSQASLSTTGTVTITFTCTDTGNNFATETVTLNVIPPVTDLGTAQSVVLQINLQPYNTPPPTVAPPPAPPPAAQSQIILQIASGVQAISPSTVSSVVAQGNINVISTSCSSAAGICEILAQPITDLSKVTRLPTVSPALIAGASHYAISAETPITASLDAQANSPTTSLCGPSGALSTPCSSFTSRRRQTGGTFTAVASSGAFSFNVTAMVRTSFPAQGSTAMNLLAAQILSQSGIPTSSQDIECKLRFAGSAMCWFTTTHFVTNADITTLTAAANVMAVQPAAWISTSAMNPTVGTYEATALDGSLIGGTVAFTIDTSAPATSLSNAGAVDVDCIAADPDGLQFLTVCNGDLVCRNKLYTILSTGVASQSDAADSVISRVLSASDSHCNTKFLTARTPQGSVSASAAAAVLLANGITTNMVYCVENVCNYQTAQGSVTSGAAPTLTVSPMMTSLAGVTAATASTLAPAAPVMGAIQLANPGVSAASVFAAAGMLPTHIDCDSNGLCIFTVPHASAVHMNQLAAQSQVTSTVGPVALSVNSSAPVFEGSFSFNSTVITTQQATSALLNANIAPTSVTCTLGTCSFRSQMPITLSDMQTRFSPLRQASESFGRTFSDVVPIQSADEVGAALRQAIMDHTGARSGQIVIVSVAQTSQFNQNGEVAITINPASNANDTYRTSMVISSSLNLVPVLSGAGIMVTSLGAPDSGVVTFTHTNPLTPAQLLALSNAGATMITTDAMPAVPTGTISSLLEAAANSAGTIPPMPLTDGTLTVTGYCSPICTSAPTAPTPAPSPAISVGASSGGGGDSAGFSMLYVYIIVAVVVVAIIGGVLYARGGKGENDKVTESKIHTASFENPLYEDGPDAAAATTADDTQGYSDVPADAPEADPAGIYDETDDIPPEQEGIYDDMPVMAGDAGQGYMDVAGNEEEFDEFEDE